jgi:hypothetical protein
MKDNGKTINQTVMENTSIQMEWYTKVSGKTINKTERELKFGQMVKSMRDNLKWE